MPERPAGLPRGHDPVERLFVDGRVITVLCVEDILDVGLGPHLQRSERFVQCRAEFGVVGRYGAAIAAGDMSALAATLTDDAVWHQPGANRLSGDHLGADAIVAHLGEFMQRSGGTFTLETESATESGNLVATTVRFTAQREGTADLDQHGVDVFRVEGDRIAEIWLISEDQHDEDRFWG